MSRSFVQIDRYNPFGAQAKLLWHTDRLCQFLQTGSTFPIHVEISPTSVCNMNCDWCISSYLRKNEHIDKDLLLMFIEDFKNLGGKAIGWSGGGEPTCYPHLKEAVLKADELGLKQGLFTNGLIPEDLMEVIGTKMTWVRFALDTTNKSAFCEKKHVPSHVFDDVLRNLEWIRYYPARVVVNAELDKWNATHMGDVVDTAFELGADVVQIRPVLPRPYMTQEGVDRAFYQRQISMLIDLEAESKGDKQIFISWDKFLTFTTANPKEQRYDSCQYHHFFCVLNANGDLGVCMYRLDDDNFIFGNIYDNKLEEIWNSEKRKKVIKYCNEDIEFDKCQICCKGHELNKFLYFIQHPLSRSDPDFL